MRYANYLKDRTFEKRCIVCNKMLKKVGRLNVSGFCSNCRLSIQGNKYANFGNLKQLLKEMKERIIRETTKKIEEERGELINLEVLND